MESQTNKRKPRVLLIEDDRSVRRMLALSLCRAGFDIEEAVTGGEALSMLGEPELDAVILDLGLPDDRGGEVLRRLQNNTRGGKSRVWVTISALDRQDATLRYGDPGAWFLSKPFDPWDLVRMLCGLLINRDHPETDNKEK